MVKEGGIGGWIGTPFSGRSMVRGVIPLANLFVYRKDDRKDLDNSKGLVASFLFRRRPVPEMRKKVSF